MEFRELVELRKSIRAYKDEKVKSEDVEKIIAIAQKAPSWKNLQPSRFYAALSEEAISAVYESLPEYNQRSTVHAAYIITTFKKGQSGSLGDHLAEEGDLWGAYDLGLSNAYLILEAVELGYDTLIMGIRDEKKIRAYFKIGDDEIIMPVIALGKRNQDPAPRPRKDLKEVYQAK